MNKSKNSSKKADAPPGVRSGRYGIAQEHSFSVSNATKSHARYHAFNFASSAIIYSGSFEDCVRAIERQKALDKNPEQPSAPSEAPRNDPNANYAAYELDRVAKRKAQEPAKAEKHTFEQGSFGPTTKPLCKHCGLSDKAQSHFGPRSSKVVEHPKREDSGSTPDADSLQSSIEAIHKEIQSSLTAARQTPEYKQEGIELESVNSQQPAPETSATILHSVIVNGKKFNVLSEVGSELIIQRPNGSKQYRARRLGNSAIYGANRAQFVTEYEPPAARQQLEPETDWDTLNEAAEYIRHSRSGNIEFSDKVQSGIERVKAQRDGLLAAAKAALNDVNTARRHVYTGISANPDDMTFDAIENTLEPSTRLLQSAIAAAEWEGK